MQFEKNEVGHVETVGEVVNTTVDKLNQCLAANIEPPDKFDTYVSICFNEDKSKRLRVYVETRTFIDDNPHFEKGQE